MKLRFIAAICALFGATLTAGPVQSADAQAKSNVKINSSAYAEPAGQNNYRSDYFGLSISAPSGWVLASENEAEKILNTGTDLVAGDDTSMRRDMDLAVRTSLPLFFISRHAMSAGRSDNINVSSVAEKISHIPYEIDGKAYFDNMKRIAAQSATPISFIDGYSDRVIDGHTFTSMKAEINIQGTTIRQEYLAIPRGDHMVGIIATYLTDDDKFMLDGILSSIKLD